MQHIAAPLPPNVSAAVRELAEERAELDVCLLEVESEAAATAEGLTGPELAAVIDRLSGRPEPSAATHRHLAERYVSLTVRQSEAHRRLAALLAAAQADQRFADALNQAIDGCAATSRRMQTAPDAAYAARQHAPDVLKARSLARYAEQVAEGVACGLELRFAALAVAHEAMTAVFALAAHPGRITPDGAGLAFVADAQGGASFLRLALPVLGENIPQTLLGAC